MEQTICAVCGGDLYGRWTDTHGIAACSNCGLPYRLYHYENDERVDKRPSIAVKESWLLLAREYWAETQRRVFPGAFDMGIFRSRGGRTYSGATEDEMREFDEWLNMRKDRWPVEEPASDPAIGKSVEPAPAIGSALRSCASPTTEEPR